MLWVCGAKCKSEIMWYTYIFFQLFFPIVFILVESVMHFISLPLPLHLPLSLCLSLPLPSPEEKTHDVTVRIFSNSRSTWIPQFEPVTQGDT